MANCSFAKGYIDMTADSEKAIDLIIKSFKATEGFGYGITLTKELEREELDDGKFYYSSCFEGEGKWTFENNIHNHFRWAIINKDLTDEEFEFLEQSDFEINFDFVDYEPGMEVFYKTYDKLEHSKGDDLEETNYISGEYDDLDYSWGAFLIEEVESMESLGCWIEGEEPEKVYERLEEERAGLEEYFEEPLEDIIRKYWSDTEIPEKYEEGKKLNKEELER